MWNKNIISQKQSSGKSIDSIYNLKLKTYPLWKQLMYDKNIFPVISVFHSHFCALALYIPLIISLGSHPYLLPLILSRKTEIGCLTEEDIIYPRLLLKSYTIPGFKLYTEKQSNTSAGNHPSWWKDTPGQAACFTYRTHQGCHSKGDGWWNSLLCGPWKGVYS